MTANKYTGEVGIKLGGKNCTLVYDWRAISDLHSELPDDLSNGLIDVGRLHDTMKLATVLAIGLKKHHPEITPEEILDMCPAIVPLKTAIDQALAYAYFGPDLLTGLQTATKVLLDQKKKNQTEKKSQKKKST